MAKTIDVALKDLASISRKLNEVSDQFSKHLADVESALASHKLGVTAYVELDRHTEPLEPNSDDPRQITVVQSLSYGKRQGKWGLLVSTSVEEFAQEPDEQFLRDAARETRLAAVERIPDLLVALAKEAERVAAEAAKKAEKVRQIAIGLGKKTQ